MLSCGIIASHASAQDVMKMETYPAKTGVLYQEYDSYQLDDTLPDVVSMTELKGSEPSVMPIAVPPLGNHANIQLKKLRVPSEPGLPAYEPKGELNDPDESLYPERTFFLVVPQKKTSAKDAKE